jgi:hypothetical protein
MGAIKNTRLKNLDPQSGGDKVQVFWNVTLSGLINKGKARPGQALRVPGF